MKWLIQNTVNQQTFDKLISAIQESSAEYEVVKVVPFSDIIVPAHIDINEYYEHDVPRLQVRREQPIFVVGSHTLSSIANDRGWKPGSFISDNSALDNLGAKWGKHNMLNGEGVVSDIERILSEAEIPHEWDKVFARPLHDTKAFAGKVFDRAELINYFTLILNLDEIELNGSTEVVISKPRKIYSEYRLFVIDGIIETGSLYAVDGIAVSEKKDSDREIPDDVLKFAKAMIDEYQPERAFVMDVGVTDEGPKVIEVNDISSSGFYNSDVEKFVLAINKMV